MTSQRYELLEPLANGERSTVFRARDRHLDRDVVLKRRPIDQVLFHEREAAALHRVSHPHIVNLWEAFTDADGPCLVLEFLKGETLHTRIQRGPLTLQQWLLLARQGLQTLSAIHAAGLLHRDITPDNLMLLPLGSDPFNLKVIDFELAQPLAQLLPDTATGSVHFMAPEQFENIPPDGRTDLYAFGAVLHFAATQRHPFSGDSQAQIITAHLYDIRQPLEPLAPRLPPPFDQWISRLLSRSPDQRPASAAEALTLLDAVEISCIGGK